MRNCPYCDYSKIPPLGTLLSGTKVNGCQNRFRVTTHNPPGEWWDSSRSLCRSEVKWHCQTARTTGNGGYASNRRGDGPAVDSKHFEVTVAFNYWNLHSFSLHRGKCWLGKGCKMERKSSNSWWFCFSSTYKMIWLQLFMLRFKR